MLKNQMMEAENSQIPTLKTVTILTKNALKLPTMSPAQKPQLRNDDQSTDTWRYRPRRNLDLAMTQHHKNRTETSRYRTRRSDTLIQHRNTPSFVPQNSSSLRNATMSMSSSHCASSPPHRQLLQSRNPPRTCIGAPKLTMRSHTRPYPNP